MTGKNGTQLVANSRLAHEHVRELMIELQGIDLDEAEFEVKFHELMGIVREHVAEEENVMFPVAEADAGRPTGRPDGSHGGTEAAADDFTSAVIPMLGRLP